MTFESYHCEQRLIYSLTSSFTFMASGEPQGIKKETEATFSGLQPRGVRDAMADAVTDARVNIKIELFGEARKAAWFNSTADSGEEAWQMKCLLGQALKPK